VTVRLAHGERSARPAAGAAYGQVTRPGEPAAGWGMAGRRAGPTGVARGGYR